MITTEDRLIELEQMTNVRDLGGYETLEGRLTKMGRYIRSSSPANATEEDIQKLKNYGVKVALDLRSDFEKSVQPSPFKDDPDVDYVEINLLSQEEVHVVPEEVRTYKDLGGLYCFTIEANKDTFRQVFELFYEHPYDGILFHCSAGKDRTGLVAALLLELCAVDDYMIVKDYSLSYEYNMKMIEQMKDLMDEETIEYLSSSPRYMMIFLAYLREHYVSARGYLLDIGLSEDQVDDIREMFLI